MHDGIHLEKAGVPSVTICTDAFETTAKTMSAMWGAPNYPVVFTEHPIAPLSNLQLKKRAGILVKEILSVLTCEIRH